MSVKTVNQYGDKVWKDSYGNYHRPHKEGPAYIGLDGYQA
jgi:hypothetical protein